jgi:hypothetical protein
MDKYRDDTLEAWKLAIEDGLEYRREYGREAEWARNESMFYQAHNTQVDNVGPNLLYSTGDSLLSSLLVPNPFFILKPLRMDTVQSTPVLESQLNTLLYALQIKQEMESAGNHAYLYSKGILKIGYDSEFGYCPEEDIGQSAGQIFGISLSQFDKKGSRIEFDQTIQPGMPWVRSVLPHDFVVPRGTRDLKNCPWCAHRIVRHIDDIMADPKYENKKDLQPTMSMDDWVKSYLTVMKPYRMGKTQWNGRREQGDMAEYVEMWEIHDARTGRIYVMAQDHDEFLRNDIDYLQVDGLPFVDLTFVPKARTFWTTPDSVYLQSAQNEAIDIAHMQRKQRRISLARFMYKKGAITNDNLVKFFSGQIGVGVEVESTGEPLKEAIEMFTPYNSNNQLQMEAEAIRRDARESVGFGRNQNGNTNPGRPTATEVNIANDKAEMRMDRRQDALAKCYCDIGRKLSKVIFTYWKTPRLVEILGPDGAAQWTTFTGSALKGEYQFQVGFSSEPVETRTNRINTAMTLYQALAQDPTINQLELRRNLIRAVNDPSFTSLFLPGVSQNANLQQAMPQLQQSMGLQQQNDVGGRGSPPSPGGNSSVSQVPSAQSPNLQQSS